MKMGKHYSSSRTQRGGAPYGQKTRNELIDTRNMQKGGRRNSIAKASRM